MPLYAIFEKGPGEVRVIEEFRRGPTQTAVKKNFVDDYDPPLNPDDYRAVDTGWEKVQKAGKRKRWAFDKPTSSLVAIDTNAPLSIRDRVASLEARVDALENP